MDNTTVYKRVELLLKLGGTKNYDENDSLRDLDLERTTKLIIENCSLLITGDYLIITKNEESKIYNLNEIDSYRVFKR